MKLLKTLLPTAVVTTLMLLLAIGCKPKVETPDNPATETTLSLNKSAVELTVGKSVTLTATLTPADAKEPITWTSSDPATASVAGGQVKGLKAGAATITASIKSGASAKCTITVKGAAKEETKTTIALDRQTASLELGQTLTLKATLTPADAKDEIAWSSSDDKVATVRDGVVTPLAKGVATIKAALKSGATAECVVTVTVPDAPASGSLKAKSETIEVIKGEKHSILDFVDLLTPLQKTADGKDGRLLLEEIKTVDKDRGEVTLLLISGTTFEGASVGTTRLSVKRTDNNESIEVKVVVKNKEFDLPKGAHIVVTDPATDREVTAVKVAAEMPFELAAKLLDGEGKVIRDVEILRSFTGDILGPDFTNPNKITTSDEGKVKVIYTVAGSDVRVEIPVDCSYDPSYKGVEYTYKQ